MDRGGADKTPLIHELTLKISSIAELILLLARNAVCFIPSGKVNLLPRQWLPIRNKQKHQNREGSSALFDETMSSQKTTLSFSDFRE